MCIWFLHTPCTELPAPHAVISLTSSTGSGDDSCLGATFTDSSNSLICVADVVSNLLETPNITITRDRSPVNTASANTLTHSLSASDSGEFTCIVCIDVPEAGIVNYCSSSTVVISSRGECSIVTLYGNSTTVCFFHSTRPNHI